MSKIVQGEGSIRLLTASDIPQAVELSSSAGWNQTADDWQMLIDLNRESCFALDCDGQLASTATLCCYGKRLAWVGMVLTRADLQRRGFARRLLERVLAHADGRGIRTVKLDATTQGEQLYGSLGFVVEQDIQRWSGRSLGGGPPRMAAARDLLPFGNERAGLFGSLARRSKVWGDEEGFVMSRSGTRARYLGPCVARSLEKADVLVAEALASDAGPWLWDLLPANHGAVALATKFGFRGERHLLRMVRGEPFREDESRVYAIAGFELG